MILTWLCDSDGVEGIVVSEVTTSKEIEDIITEVKNNHPDDYSSEDLLEALPNDCTLEWMSADKIVEW